MMTIPNMLFQKLFTNIDSIKYRLYFIHFAQLITRLRFIIYLEYLFITSNNISRYKVENLTERKLLKGNRRYATLANNYVNDSKIKEKGIDGINVFMDLNMSESGVICMDNKLKN